MAAEAGFSTRQIVLAAVVLAFCLVAGAPSRVVGDGGEYLAQALNFASGSGPAITGSDVPNVQDAVVRSAPMLADWQISESLIPDPRGRGDFVHFWFYAALATPFVWIADVVGANPLVGFLALNLALFALAVGVVCQRVGVPASLLLFFGPIVWWLDKPHTEIFTFALLAIAMASLRDRPWWSLVAVGAASTQNPPIAALLPLIGVILALRGTSVMRDRRVLAAGAAALALAALHPLYSWDRHGVASLLLAGATEGVPTPREWLAVIVDPDIGLAANFPVFVLLVVIAGALLTRRTARDTPWPELALAGVAAGWFLFSFARTGNFHHGGTPSVSRYALWLVPLGIPLLAAVHRAGGALWRRVLMAGAVVSAAASVVIFHPSVAENSREPTWLAEWVWTRAPAWSTPLPEIFAEAIAHQEQPMLPQTTAGCEKILTVGRDGDGVWPVPCFPAEPPAWCLPRGAYCYANRTATGYDFVAAPGRLRDAGLIDRARVWPREAEPVVRQVFTDMGWLDLEDDGLRTHRLRSIHRVRARALAADDRLLVVFSQAEEGAVVSLRTPSGMTGRLLDARTGATLTAIRYDGPAFDLWDVPVPPDPPLTILVLRRDAPE